MRLAPMTCFFAALVLMPTLRAAAQAPMGAPPPPLRAGTRAPAFGTQTTDGKRLTLNSLRGKVVLLDFWATWCGPCKMATPTLTALQRQFHGRGFTVVGMSVDDPTTAAQVKPFVKAMHMTYPVAVSPAANSRTAQAYKVDGIPSQYLIDKRGIVRWSQSGFSLGEGRDLSRRIRRLLAEK